MENPFTITILDNKNTIPLTDGVGDTTITVTNNSKSGLKAQAEIKQNRPEAGAWLSVAEDVRHFPSGSTEQFVVKVNVPKGAPEGDYSFVVRISDVADPNERTGDSPVLAFKVVAAAPIVKPNGKKFPWWIVIAASAAFVLIVGGVVVWALTREPGKKVTNTNKAYKLTDYKGHAAKAVVEELFGKGIYRVEVKPVPVTQPGQDGLVSEQDPQPGISVVPESRVTLTVHENAKKPPPVIGQPLGGAVNKLRNEGFFCCWIKISGESGSDFEVTKQDPSDVPTSRAQKITLEIKDGPRNVLKEAMKTLDLSLAP